jgi:uncharacterized protein YqeY
MDLKERLNADMKESLKAGEKLRLSTIRLLLSEIKNAEIAKRGDLTDEELLAAVSREARKRKESIAEYEKGGRKDLVEKETAELAVLEAYMPEQLSEGELRGIIEETVKQVGATSPGDLGKVMGALMPCIRGKADGKLANRLASEMLERP